MRNSKGQFIKGERASKATEFQKGQHWREHKPYWDREWLEHEYCDKQRSTSEIAEEFGVTANGIAFWLNKHGIPTRSMSEVRSIKHWGAEGEKNPMFGIYGELHPSWKGGVTPERQQFYKRAEWREVVAAVWERDKGICQRCGTYNTNRRRMHIHHIVTYKNKKLIGALYNLVLLCAKCHHFVHSDKNIEGEFMSDGEEVQ